MNGMLEMMVMKCVHTLDLSKVPLPRISGSICSMYGLDEQKQLQNFV